MTRSRLWFIITLLLAVLTGLLVYRYLASLQETTVSEVMTTQVMARTRIAPGTRLSADMLQTTEVPVKYANPSGAQDAKPLVNQYALAEILPGEVVLTGRVASEKTAGELPYKIPPGNRAVTVPVNALTGVAGLIKPGYYVDVLVSFRTGDKVEDVKVITLLQNVLVLAVGSETQRRDGVQAVENVTLAADPTGAQLAALGENLGRLKLVVRPPGDDTKPTLPYVDVTRMLTQYP